MAKMHFANSVLVARGSDRVGPATMSHRLSTSKDTNSAHAVSNWRFTTTWSKSDLAAISARAVSNRLAITSGDSVPRPDNRLTSSSQLGGARNTDTTSGMAFLTA